MFASILCPVDFSDCSRHALEQAIELASKVGTTVTVLHVVEPPDPLLEKQEFIDYLTQHYKAPLNTLMGQVHTQHPALVQAKAVVLQGKVPTEIVRYALAHGHGLIVLGTHGRTGLAHALLGSVAERVVRTAGIPVLTIPPAACVAHSPTA